MLPLVICGFMFMKGLNNLCFCEFGLFDISAFKVENLLSTFKWPNFREAYTKMIIPMLVCRDAGAEINFCMHSFDAIELSCRKDENGNVVHATLKIGEALLMVHGEIKHLASRAPQLDGTSPIVIYYCDLSLW
jgi:hypothetical protein